MQPLTGAVGINQAEARALHQTGGAPAVRRLCRKASERLGRSRGLRGRRQLPTASSSYDLNRNPVSQRRLRWVPSFFMMHPKPTATSQISKSTATHVRKYTNSCNYLQ